MTIGDRIRMKREELHMSQEDLALKLGYKSRSSVNKIEREASGLPQSKIVAIAKALNTTPEYLLGWDVPHIENGHTIPDKTVFDIEDPQLRRLMIYYKLLSTRDKDTVEALMRTLAERKDND